jgi:hypothetical protein
MNSHKAEAAPKPRQVRKCLMVDAEKLEKAKKILAAPSDTEALRMALDHFLRQQEQTQSQPQPQPQPQPQAPPQPQSHAEEE